MRSTPESEAQLPERTWSVPGTAAPEVESKKIVTSSLHPFVHLTSMQTLIFENTEGFSSSPSLSTGNLMLSAFCTGSSVYLGQAAACLTLPH
eukprot:scaffold21009_cov16-Tisochrysis_lutea.AAC.1